VLCVTGPSQEELWKIREAINKASSLEEVERLNRLLQSGQIPGRSRPSIKGEYQLLFTGLNEAALTLRLQVSCELHSEAKEPTRCDKVCSFTCFGQQYAHHQEYN
jgi:hypothetical protein